MLRIIRLISVPQKKTQKRKETHDLQINEWFQAEDFQQTDVFFEFLLNSSDF